MKRPEQNLWTAMRKAKPQWCSAWRVENSAFVGMGDVWVLFEGGASCWVELKVVHAPARPTSYLFPPSQIKKEQRAFHKSIAAKHGASFIVMRDQHKQLYLIPGSEYDPLHYEAAVVEFSLTGWNEIYHHMRRIAEERVDQ